ncbi:MAG: tetratricopeptide repeat protein [Bradymonadales bacterium]|nr:tetratricopeptide repeat protein [Bradymonadales bacterium]
MERFYIRQTSGEVFGPFEQLFVERLIAEGNLTGEEGISQDGTTWIPILALPVFARAFEGQGPKATRRRTERPPQERLQATDHRDETVPYPSDMGTVGLGQQPVLEPGPAQPVDFEDFGQQDAGAAPFPPPVDDEDSTPPGDREATVWARPRAPGMTGSRVPDTGNVTDVAIPPLPGLSGPPALRIDLPSGARSTQEQPSTSEAMGSRPSSAFDELMDVLDRKSGLLQIPATASGTAPTRGQPSTAGKEKGPESAPVTFPELPVLRRQPEEDFATPYGVRVVLPLPVEAIPELPIPKRYGLEESDMGGGDLSERDVGAPGAPAGEPPAAVPGERRGRGYPSGGEQGGRTLRSRKGPPPIPVSDQQAMPTQGPEVPELPGLARTEVESWSFPDVQPELPAPVGREGDQWGISEDQPEQPAAYPSQMAPQAVGPELPVPVGREGDQWGIPARQPEMPTSRPTTATPQTSRPELPVLKEEFIPEPLAPPEDMALPGRRTIQSELPVRREVRAELPVPRIGDAELPVRKEGMVELPTVQLEGKTSLPGRREGAAELPTSRFGGTGLPTSSEWSTVPSGMKARPGELPAARYNVAQLPEPREGTLVEDQGVEPTRQLLVGGVDSAFQRTPAPLDEPGDEPPFPADRYAETIPSAHVLDMMTPLPEEKGLGIGEEPLDKMGRPGVSPIPGPIEEQLFDEEVAAYALPTRERPSAEEAAPTRILTERAEVLAGPRPKEKVVKVRPEARRRSRWLPYVALAVLLGLIWFGAAVVPDLISSRRGDDNRSLAISPDGVNATPQVVTRAPAVSLDLLGPGTYGSYVSFLQQAMAAVENTGGQDLEAVARQVVGQSLMAIQYGSDASLTGDLAERVSRLTDAGGEIQQLALGACAAMQGDTRRAEEQLGQFRTGQYAPWASLFLGLAEYQRYLNARTEHQDRSRPAGVEMSTPPSPAETEAERDRELPVESRLAGESGQEPSVDLPAAPEVPPMLVEETASDGEEEPAGQTEPVLGEAMGAHLAMAIRLSPELVVAHYFQGVGAVIAGRREDAMTSFRRTVELFPQHMPAVLSLSELLFGQGEFTEARTLLGTALEFPAGQSSERERSRVHQLLGQIALARQEFNEAVEALKQAFYADPTNTMAVRQLDHLFFQTGRYDEAVEFFGPHATAGAANAEVLAALAHNRLGQGDDDGDSQVLQTLAAELQTAQDTFPEDPRFPYYLGRVSQALIQFDQAEIHYRNAIQRDTSFVPGYLGLADLARQANQTERALAYLNEGVQYGEASADAEQEIGDAYLLLGYPDLAMEAFRRAIRIDPYHIEARLELTRQLVEQGSPEQLAGALQHLRTIENIGVDMPVLQALFARVFYGLGELNQARDRMQRISTNEQMHGDPEHHYLLGRIHFDIAQLASSQGDTPGARENFESARANFSAAFAARREMAEARHWEGRAYLALGETDNALPSLRNAFEMTLRDGHPSGEYRYWLGLCQEMLGQYQSALESYLLVDRFDLRWALQNPVFYYRRGRLLAGLEHLRRAQRDLEWALILDRGFVEASQTLAEVFFRQQRYQEAVDQWLRSLEILPGQPAIHYRLGTTWVRLDNVEQAVHHLERARDLGYGAEQPELHRTLGFLYRDWPAGRRTAEAIESFRAYLASGATERQPDLRVEIMNQIRQLGGTP